MQIPNRIDKETLVWFYTQHCLLWDWVASLTETDIMRILKEYPDYTPDYAIRIAWPDWEGHWGQTYGSYACEVSGNTAKRCFKCPLGSDYCQREDSGYQKFLKSIKDGDIKAFKEAALEIKSAWKKPKVEETNRGWW